MGCSVHLNYPGAQFLSQPLDGRNGIAGCTGWRHHDPSPSAKEIWVDVTQARKFLSRHRVCSHPMGVRGEQLGRPSFRCLLGACDVSHDGAGPQLRRDGSKHLAHRKDWGGEDDDVGTIHRRRSGIGAFVDDSPNGGKRDRLRAPAPTGDAVPTIAPRLSG